MESGSRFDHDPSVIAYAYQLVNEYIKHEKEQDALTNKADPYIRTGPKKVWTKGGMIKHDEKDS